MHVFRGLLRRRAALALLLLMLAPAGLLHAQEAALDAAIETYYAGDYDTAIDQFAGLAYTETHPNAVRRDALQFLGRAYLAKSAHDKAREAIATLIGLEPPIIELDPDVEPPPIMRIYYDVRKQQEDQYTVERADPGLQTLAVIDFTNSSIDDRERYAPLERGFPSMMIHNLNGAAGMKVVERERIQWLLDELNLQKDPSLIDQSTAVRAGKLLGAHAVLIGSYTVHGKQIWISARLVKVETGEILLSEQIFGKPDKFFELIEKLSNQVAQSIGTTKRGEDLGVRTETRSLDAMITYSEGLEMLESQDYQAAYDKFMEALDMDPAYERARTKAQSLAPMLAASSAAPAPTDGNDTGR